MESLNNREVVNCMPRGNSKRGLASADKETRQRVAREGGKASGESRRNNR